MSCRLFVFNGLCLVSYVIWLGLHTLASTISLNFVSFAFFTGEAAKIYIQYSNENGSAFAVEKCDKSDNNHNQTSLKIYSENGKSETEMTSFNQGTVDFVLFHNSEVRLQATRHRSVFVIFFSLPFRWLIEARHTLSLSILFIPPPPKTYDTSYSLSLSMQWAKLIMKLIN